MSKTDLDEIEDRLRMMREGLASAIPELFWQGYYSGQINGAFEAVKRLKAQQKPPALAPGKHEPEPIILAAKKPRPRAQKGH